MYNLINSKPEKIFGLLVVENLIEFRMNASQLLVERIVELEYTFHIIRRNNE